MAAETVATPSTGARGEPVLIPAGTTFSPDDITFFQGKDSGRTLDEAVREADVLVSCPHSGDRIPAELSEFLAPEFTHRLQYDFSDRTTGPIVRRWAEIDPRIIYVENPHPRMIRDPNRERPENIRETLREAFARVEAVGRWNRVDLSGVDAIRPVTFSFYPLLVPPATEQDLDHLASTFERVAERGLGVYEQTRDDLLGRMTELALARAASGEHARFTTLSFHDTMNHTTTRDGAVTVERAEADRLPNVVALSNRGDHRGEPRGENVVTMDPALVRSLATAHRAGFSTANDDDVQLNQPYLGSNEIIRAGARFSGLADRVAAASASGGLAELSAVQAEFLREFLLGGRATAELQQPGVDWPSDDKQHIDDIAQACKRSWDLFRSK
ncbi:N-formylglutamate amidohydrolase [Lysinibacter cavernae]|uniref:N-formylglutamate amidohydrolase n=1 Tax=Lysinibacter cavernae TaxID=1640652 RepID=A0A7X5R1R6_9MICO|nr:N-formylglutamate amidohydrolase [Lysinibacter cavernae]NIH54105.1 hypothetical protein [Lysinibacter cavernae]